MDFMETYTLVVMGIATLCFAAAGVYLRMLRKRSENAAPELFLNPYTKHKPKKKK